MSSRDDSGTSLTGENTGLVRPEATASASDTETEDVTRHDLSEDGASPSSESFPHTSTLGPTFATHRSSTGVFSLYPHSPLAPSPALEWERATASSSCPEAYLSSKKKTKSRPDSSQDRTRTLLQFTAALLSLGRRKAVDVEFCPKSSDEATLADSYAVLANPAGPVADVTAAVAFRSLHPSDTSLLTPFTLQLAYNGSIDTTACRSAYDKFAALVAVLRARNTVIQCSPLVPDSAPCTQCAGLPRAVGVEDSFFSLVVDFNSAMIHEFVQKKLNAVLALLSAHSALATTVRQGVTAASDQCFVCGSWMPIEAPSYGRQALMHFLDLLGQYKRSPALWQTRLRKTIVLAAYAVSHAEDGEFLPFVSSLAHDTMSGEHTLEHYVTRLSRIVDAVVCVLAHPVPTAVELIGDDTHTVDFPPASALWRSLGPAALAAVDVACGHARHETLLQLVANGLRKEDHLLERVPVHAEVKLLVHWMQAGGAAPIGGSRAPCFLCAAFFEAVRTTHNGNAAALDDPRRQVFCGQSNRRIYTRWAFPDISLGPETDQRTTSLYTQLVFKKAKASIREQLARSLAADA